VDYALASSPKHVQVSIWNGVTMGGGVGLSIHGKFRVATEKTLFAMPETGIGFFPDVGATYALPRIAAGPEVGLYLALTGARLNPGNCLLTGVATHFCPSSKLAELKSSLCKLKDPSDASSVAQVLEEASKTVNIPEPTLTPHMDAIRRCFSKPSAESIVLALQSEGSDWANTTLKQILGGSPLSVKVTMEALRRHAQPQVSLRHAFHTEFRLSQHFMTADSDFVEGIRAVLIDKDQKPKWRHLSLEQVTSAEVDTYFAPLPAGHVRGELYA